MRAEAGQDKDGNATDLDQQLVLEPSLGLNLSWLERGKLKGNEVG